VNLYLGLVHTARKSIALAPQAIQREHDAAVQAQAIRQGRSDYLSPVINATRQHEVDEQVARLLRHGVDVPPACLHNLDDLNALIDLHKSAIPFLANVKTRLCIDLSRAINQRLVPWSFSYMSMQDAMDILHPNGFLAKIENGANAPGLDENTRQQRRHSPVDSR
jgi:hypothetical protein